MPGTVAMVLLWWKGCGAVTIVPHSSWVEPSLDSKVFSASMDCFGRLYSSGDCCLGRLCRS